MAAFTDRLTRMLEAVAAEGDLAVKTASTKTANEDPGHIGGKSSQPAAKAENNEREASEGERSSENSSYVKDNVPSAVDSTEAATPGNAPTAEEAHLAPATSTGKDPANEKPDSHTSEDPGYIGGETSHPSGDQKYASLSLESVKKLPDAELYKLASDLGNEVLADLAVQAGKQEPAKPAPKTAAQATPKTAADSKTVEDAAAAGAKAAIDAARLEKMAALVDQAARQGEEDADLVYAYLAEEMANLNKQAADVDDAGGPAAEGEDHADPAAAAAESGAAPGGEELLALMGGGDAGGGGDPGAPPPEAAPPGPPMGADPAAAGGIPPEMDGMNQDQALQQLAMALLELGIDPAALAAAAGPGPKLAQKVASFKQSGKFQFSEAKTATDRRVRTYMKNFLRELVKA